MQVRKTDNGYSLILDRNEISLLHQCFNEVLHGFVVDDFEEKIGSKMEAISAMKKLEESLGANEISQQEMSVSLPASLPELTLYRNVIGEVCKEMEDWEFSMRVGGIKKDIAEELLKKLQDIIVEQS